MFDNDLDWIFHLAAKTSVQESIEDPKLYNTNKKGYYGGISIIIFYFKGVWHQIPTPPPPGSAATPNILQ